MNGDGRPRYRRQRRGGSPCNGSGPGRNGRKGTARSSEGGLGGRTATRALVAVGAYVVQDVRDAEGLTRPLLRRTALRLALSRREPVRRLGGVYLRLDPPTPSEVPAQGETIEVGGPPPAPRTLPPPRSTASRSADSEKPAC